MATKASKIHELLSTHHQFAAEEHTKAAESLGKDAPGHGFHAAMAEHHTQMAESHQSECDSAAKAAADEILKVSAIAPTIPVRAVLRPGQRGFEKTEVPAEFAKFVTRVADEDN
jgi:hypothetical protein